MAGSPPKALVVDDDPALRMLVRVNLELEGFAVSEAETLDGAKRALADSRPDVVLLDLHVGREDSGPLLRELRAAGVRVAVVTGSADVADYQDLADGVLEKPFEPSSLIELARRLARVGP
jgi:two-component system KDP operon response regulator KdpE